jgi:hypothetical protein
LNARRGLDSANRQLAALLGDSSDARGVYETRRKAYGDRDERTLDAGFDLVRAFLLTKDPEHGMPHAAHVYAVRLELFGECDLRTKMAAGLVESLNKLIEPAPRNT